MDIINVKNLVALLKDRCGKIDISNEIEFPTTRGLLMHAAILIEDRILNARVGTVGYFLLHSPFTYSTKIKVVKHDDVLIKMTEYGKLMDKLTDDIFNMEIDYAHIVEFMPSPNSDILVPLLEIHVK